MMTLAHQLERTVVIGAPPAAVFTYFTDPERWAAWWGAGSTIDARPGGRALVRHPGGVEASGEVVEIDAPSRIVFTYRLCQRHAVRSRPVAGDDSAGAGRQGHAAPPVARPARRGGA